MIGSYSLRGPDSTRIALVNRPHWLLAISRIEIAGPSVHPPLSRRRARGRNQTMHTGQRHHDVPRPAGPDLPARPANLIYELPSITDRLVLEQLFPQPQPVEVELGCGDASFLVAYAQRHPERNFLGVERLWGRLRKLDRKGRRAGLTNLRGVRLEAGYFLEWLLPPHAVSALHVYFPDPWPKTKHRRHRLINERFPAVARQALARGGVVYLRTDDADYFAQMTAVFAAAPEFQPVATPPELAELLTDFEKDFQARGIETRRAAYRWE